jgi:peptidyl-prolyl cis-trans isomerase D
LQTYFINNNEKHNKKMAVIGKIRKHSGWIVALIGLAIAGFILQDAFMGDGPGGRKIPKFAIIDGEEIKIQQFEERVDRIAEQFRMQQDGMPLSQEDLHMVRERVWTQMVGDILTERSAQRLGITVTTREMNDMFYGQFIHPHVFSSFGGDPMTGRFDRQQVMMFINNFNQVPVEQQRLFRDLEVSIREDRLRNKYYNVIANAHYVPTFYVNHQYEKANSAASAIVAALNFADIPDSEITLTDADFKTYLNNNKSLFERTETSRAIDFVVFDVHPTEDDMVALNRHAHELFEELKVETDLPNFINAVSTERFDSVFLTRDAFMSPWNDLLFSSPKGTFFAPEIRRGRYEMAKLIDVASRPDSLKANHILIGFRGSAGNQGQNRTKEEAEALADSLRREILRNRTQFATIAQAHSEDPQSAQVGGDLGWFMDGQMVRPFNEAVVNGRVGDIVVVETNFGFHVIEITGQSARIPKAMAAFIYVQIEPSSNTLQNAFTEASQFFAVARNQGLDAAAQEFRMQVRQADYVSETDMILPGIPNARNIVRWAYDKRTRVGDVSPEIYDNFDNRYVIAALRQIRQKGLPTLAEIRDIPGVLNAVLNERKAQMLIEQVNNVLKTNRSMDALGNIGAEVETVTHVAFGGYSVGMRHFEPELIGTIFGTQVNRLSNPVQGRSGVFVAQPLEFMPVEPLEDITLMRRQLMMMFQRGMVESMRNAKENRLKIVDNRAFFF